MEGVEGVERVHEGLLEGERCVYVCVCGVAGHSSSFTQCTELNGMQVTDKSRQRGNKRQQGGFRTQKHGASAPVTPDDVEQTAANEGGNLAQHRSEGIREHLPQDATMMGTSCVQLHTLAR